MLSSRTSTAGAGRDLLAVEVAAELPPSFRLESGDRLPQAAVRGRWIGPPDGPVAVALGGISSHRVVYAADDARQGWWKGIVEIGGPVDPSVHRVFGLDFSPASIPEPVTLTTHDQARLLALALDAAGIEVVDAFIGASYGGMVALAFAELFPERVERLCVIGAAHRAHPIATAWRGIQRRILAFAEACGRSEEGVALARELAMTTYRTAEEFAVRFDSRPPDQAGQPYPVCEYLIAQGEAYAGRTEPSRWISLSDSMDRHSVRPEALATPLTLVGFTSDRLVPIEDLRELAERAPGTEDLLEIESLYGHDGFLKETEQLGRILRRWLSEPRLTAPRNLPIRPAATIQTEHRL